MTRNPFLRTASISALLAALLLSGCGGDKPEALLASAKEFIAKNDNKAAAIQIKNALQANPNLPEGRLLLGKVLLEGGDAATAEIELRKAIELKASNEQTMPLLARTLNALGQHKKVIDELARTELTTPEAKADLQTSVALAQASTGDVTGAEKSVEAALSAVPDHTSALLLQARLKANGRDIPAALQLVDRVLAKAPTSFDAWKLKGDFHLGQNEIDKGIAAYRKSVEVRPDFVPGHAAIVSVLMQTNKMDEARKQFEAMKKAAPKHPQTMFLEAQIAFQSKEYAQAREVVQQLIRVAPNNPNALQLAGAVEFRLKSWLQAEAYLSKALQAQPDMMMARRVLVGTYLQSGQPARAMSTLKPVLGKIEKDANMLALAGEVFLQNGGVAEAESYFAKAAALAPKDAPKRTALAMTHLIKGDSEGAFQELEQIAAEDGGTSADMALIAAHLRRQEVDKALKAIDALEKKQPTNPLPHQIRGNALLAKNDIAGARKSFERALEVNRAYFPAAGSLASLDMADNKPDDARKRFEAIIAADAKNTQALLALAELRGRTGGSTEEVATLIGKAIAVNSTEVGPRLALVGWYMQQRDAKKAAAAAQDAVAAIPNQPELHEVLGRAQLAAGDSNQALTTFGKLAALQPASPVAHVRSAEVHMAAKNKDAAAQSLRKALEIKPDLIEAQRGLIMLALDAGKPQDALKIARDAQRQRPKESVGYLFEGDILTTRAAYDEAAAIFREGLKQAPSTDLATKYYSVLMGSNKGSDADRFASTWMKEHPKDVAFRLHLGDVSTVRKDYPGAAKMYRAVLELQPNHALALNNLAWVAGQLKDPKAIEYAERANRISPNQPALIDTLGMLLSEKGDSAKAVELLKRAVSLAPAADNIRLNYAKVLVKAGNKVEAKKELETLAKTGDKFAGHAQVTELLKGL